MCVLTVASLRNSFLAISALLRPCAARPKISFSRLVSSSKPGASPATARESKCSNSSRVCAAAMTAVPAWTVRMAASRNSGSASLSTNPLAPPRIARAAASSRSKVVSTMTRGCLPPRAAAASSRRRVDSMPSMTGMRMSISTTSGLADAARATPSTPSPASPTNSRSGWELTSIRIPARNSAWSSTRATRMLMRAPARTR